MTEADSVGTPQDRAVARVRALVEDPLREVENAGYVIGLPLREIVKAVEAELGDAALRLPRYYPADEGQAWLLGTTRHIDPDTGRPRNMYARWRTGLPGGRVHVEVVEADSASKASGVSGLDLAEFVASPDALEHTLRALLAACAHPAPQTAGAE